MIVSHIYKIEILVKDAILMINGNKSLKGTTKI